MFVRGIVRAWEKAAVEIRATCFRGMIRAPVSYFHDFFYRFFVFILPFWYIVPIFGSDKRGEKSNKTKKSPHPCVRSAHRGRRLSAEDGKRRQTTAKGDVAPQETAGCDRCRETKPLTPAPAENAGRTGKQNRPENRIDRKAE